MKSNFRSAIPVSARERIKERYQNGQKKIADCFINRKLVGRRFFAEEGYLDMEYGIQNGRMHGMMYTWSAPGKLHSAEPYKNGLAHGTALQWSQRNEKIIGRYTMKHGTGIDLWWQDYPGKNHLSEVCYMKNGRPDGFEWWIRENEQAVWHERHWKNGEFHGIERWWNMKTGTLDRKYPRYFISGKQVTKAEYIAACEKDPYLPLFRKEENSPTRIFPSEIRKHLKRKATDNYFGASVDARNSSGVKIGSGSTR